MASVQERARRATEQLLEDSSLTADLVDAQGERLLNWGVALAEHLAVLTEGLDEPEADAFLEDHLKTLRRVMRRISRLAGLARLMNPDEAIPILTDLLEHAALLPGTLVRTPDDVAAEAAILLTLTEDQALDRLLSLLVRT